MPPRESRERNPGQFSFTYRGSCEALSRAAHNMPGRRARTLAIHFPTVGAARSREKRPALINRAQRAGKRGRPLYPRGVSDRHLSRQETNGLRGRPPPEGRESPAARGTTSLNPPTCTDAGIRQHHGVAERTQTGTELRKCLSRLDSEQYSRSMSHSGIFLCDV